MTRDVWDVAVWLVSKHGAEAPRIVQSHITTLRETDGGERHVAAWLLVDDAVRGWLITKPGVLETVQ